MCVEKHHSQHFVVTCKHQMNYRGILTGFELRGYLLETYSEEGGFRQHIIHMYCDANYDDELQYLKSIYIQDFIADCGMRNKVLVLQRATSCFSSSLEFCRSEDGFD